MIKTVKIRQKNTLSISETQKMVKTTKVKVLNDPKASDFTTTKPFPDQDDKTRRLVKLLVIFCLGQAIVVVTVGSLFGVLLAAKVRIRLVFVTSMNFYLCCRMNKISLVTVTGACAL